MIEGITVLAQNEIYYIPDWVPFVIIILLFCSMIFAFVGKFINTYYWFIASVLILVGMLGLTNEAFLGHFDIYTGRYEYKCLIDESVSMSEVYDNYEVVDRDGEIWILEDLK